MPYDVIIVGAGPGGLNCAFHAAEHGAKVVVVDRKKEIGIPVRCAEGVIEDILIDANIKPTKEIVASTVKKIVMYTPDGKKLELDLKHKKGYILNRDKFEKALAKRCEKRGVQFMLNSPVVECDQKGIILKNGERLDARIIVGADGFPSTVGRSVGLPVNVPPHDWGKCVQYYARDDSFEDETIELYWLHKYSPGGYVWLFPKGRDTANVGLGVPGDAKLNAKKLLDDFIWERCPDAERITIIGGRVPLSLPAERVVRDNILLCGDAALLANPLHGGGIGFAMLSGRLAGETISRHLIDDTSLQTYEEELKKRIYWKLRKSYKVRESIMEHGLDRYYFLIKSLLWVHKIFPGIIERYALRSLRYQ